MKTPTNSRGFTLIEVMIVVALVGILATIAVSSYRHAMDVAKSTSSISALDNVKTEMEAYMIDKGVYPSSINFTNFTDQNGDPVLLAINWGRIKDKVYSWDSYTTGGGTYTLTAKALDSNHTVMTLTPEKGVTY